jgi:hypothetical protein
MEGLINASSLASFFSILTHTLIHTHIYTRASTSQKLNACATVYCHPPSSSPSQLPSSLLLFSSPSPSSTQLSLLLFSFSTLASSPIPPSLRSSQFLPLPPPLLHSPSPVTPIAEGAVQDPSSRRATTSPVGRNNIYRIYLSATFYSYFCFCFHLFCFVLLRFVLFCCFVLFDLLCFIILFLFCFDLVRFVNYCHYQKCKSSMGNSKKERMQARKLEGVSYFYFICFYFVIFLYCKSLEIEKKN